MSNAVRPSRRRTLGVMIAAMLAASCGDVAVPGASAGASGGVCLGGDGPPGTWSRSFGSKGPDVLTGVAIEAQGNMVVTGVFYTTIDFGAGSMTSAGEFDVFLAKLDTTGKALWSKRFGDANYQYGGDIAVDPSGDVVITGAFHGTVDFGAGPVAAGYDSTYVAAFDPSGAPRWSRTFDGVNIAAVAMDDAGATFLAGGFEGWLDLGGGPIQSAGGTDVLVAKLGPDGALLWARRFGDAADQTAHDMGLDADGGLRIVGTFQGDLDFGAGLIVSSPSIDVFVAKLDSGGEPIWSRHIEEPLGEGAVRVAVGGDGATSLMANLFIPGQQPNYGGILVARLSPAGELLWARTIAANTFSYKEVEGVAVDGSGDTLIVGLFEDSLDFGNGALKASDGQDAFLARFGPEGDIQESQAFGGKQEQILHFAKIDAHGNELLAGTFAGTIPFGACVLESRGDLDVFLSRMPP